METEAVMTNADLFDRITERQGILLLTGDLEMAADLRCWALQRTCRIVEIPLPGTKYISIRVVPQDLSWSIALMFAVETILDLHKEIS